MHEYQLSGLEADVYFYPGNTLEINSAKGFILPHPELLYTLHM